MIFLKPPSFIYPGKLLCTCPHRHEKRVNQATLVRTPVWVKHGCAAALRLYNSPLQSHSCTYLHLKLPSAPAVCYYGHCRLSLRASLKGTSVSILRGKGKHYFVNFCTYIYPASPGVEPATFLSKVCFSTTAPKWVEPCWGSQEVTKLHILIDLFHSKCLHLSYQYKYRWNYTPNCPEKRSNQAK